MGHLAEQRACAATLAESKEWVTLRTILQEVCDEVPSAREPLLRRMRHHVLSVTREDAGVGI
ncbi:MAG: hypothetical protein U1E48_02670 [Paracoccaceae bacterium]